MTKAIGWAALVLSCSWLAASAAPVREIITFDPAVPPAQRVRLAEAAGGRVVRELGLINAVVVEEEPTALKAAETKLLAGGSVRRVEADPKLNWLRQAAAPANLGGPLPALPRFTPSRPKLALPWGIRRVNAPGAWPVTMGRDVKVAVIDTGINTRHPDLWMRLRGGWNAIDRSRPRDFRDDNGHGTHCAGIIAAVDHGVVEGVAPLASLYAVKVLDAGGSGTFDDVIAGMQWAVRHHMQVASMSLGAPVGTPALEAAVQAMANAGVVVVAAAGNDGTEVGYPAKYAGALAVSAIDASDQLAYFSNFGPEVAFAAPGVDVFSTYQDGYAELSGTSMAAPHVSGLAALAIAAKGLSGYAQVRQALARAATPIPGLSSDEQGAGVVDAAKLVR